MQPFTFYFYISGTLTGGVLVSSHNGLCSTWGNTNIKLGLNKKKTLIIILQLLLNYTKVKGVVLSLPTLGVDGGICMNFCQLIATVYLNCTIFAFVVYHADAIPSIFYYFFVFLRLLLLLNPLKCTVYHIYEAHSYQKEADDFVFKQRPQDKGQCFSPHRWWSTYKECSG